MDKVGQLLRNRVFPDKSIIIFCAILLILVWSGTVWQIQQDYKLTIENARNDTDKFALAFEEHVRRVLKTNEQYLLLLKSEYESRGVTPSLHAMIRRMMDDPLVNQVGIHDNQGRAVISGLEIHPSLTFSDLPHFTAHMLEDTGKLYIGNPIIGRVTLRQTIHLSKRINNPDGSFGGISLISISPAYFSNFYSNMHFDEHYVVRLIGLDAVARASNREQEIGAGLSTAAVFKHLSEGNTGFYRSLGQYYGTPYLVSYRVMPEYPLIVQVGVSEQALSPMLERRKVYLSAAGGISIFILYFSASLMLRSRKQRLAEKRLQESYEQLTSVNEELAASEHETRTHFDNIASLNAQLASQNTVLSTLHETAIGLMGRLDPDEALSAIAGKLSELTGTEHVYIYILDKEKGLALRKVGLGIYAKEMNTSRYTATGMIAEVLRLKKTFIVDDYSTWEHRVDTESNRLIRANVQVPLIVGGEVIGTLGMAFTEDNRRFSPADVGLVEQFAVVAAIVIDNARKINELEQSRRTAEEIFNAAGDGFMVTDEDGNILGVNRRLTEMFGYSEDEFKQQGIVLISTPPHKEGALAKIRKTLVEGDVSLINERETHDRNGHRLVVEINNTRVVIKGKTRCLSVMRDITARKQLEEKMEFLRERDLMTGAYNRSHFETDMARIQNSDHLGIGLFVCDVDGLKLINDTLGHAQGDELLKRVAHILETGIKLPDYVARIGGDEFASVLFGPTCDQMEKLDEYYHHEVDAYNAEFPHLPLSLSLGWAMDEEIANVETVFKTADNNMYRRKMHQSQSVRSSIVQAMMKALQAKDFVTEGHADRLGDLMEEMGNRLSLSQGATADLRLLAQFHDIGKVGIPDSILKKPGKLTNDEKTVMRQHCEIGFRIAKASQDLAPIADWILKHQEHWNGGGYPLGIKEEQIPLPCRILAIIDAFDAMTNDRPYRKAMSLADAFDEILRCAGTQFDPLLAKEFVSMMKSKA
ncbi:MAG: diguanylate cyclase [Negativicutes bacterium]|nr:diguanylate cyclase [Negativicutes bacterium]